MYKARGRKEMIEDA